MIYIKTFFLTRENKSKIINVFPPYYKSDCELLIQQNITAKLCKNFPLNIISHYKNVVSFIAYP